MGTAPRRTAADRRLVADAAWSEFARALEIDEATLRAVAEVESNGDGFLPAPSDRPKVLFEGHAFHRLTGGRYDREHPDLSYPKWNRRKYAGTLAGEWRRLDAACRLDRIAALQSASWGLFQIMGFNYPYCGCADVEAFVAQQYEGATRQLALMVKFVSRPPFLPALRSHNWKAFARAYNGPGFATHGYDTRLAAAQARWAATLSAAAPRKAAAGKASALPPGRDGFTRIVEIRRENPRRRNVRPDAVDLRDWEYRPSIAIAPRDALMPHDPKPVKQQGQTNACTGFALATVIEYLLDRAQRPVELMSGFMLYSMARRYDEWAEEGDETDSGSSLRGALKGWAHHGASAERLWRGLSMPRATNDESDWWLDAVKRPLGAYYRIDPKNIRDMHVALAEVGAVYASAYTHTGWDALLQDQRSPAPASIAEVPLLQAGTGARDQGHAFAIVGYTCDGFIVQNSWGPAWGRGGFAVLPYGDWLANAMDCWVVQLGAVTTDHERVARAPSLRTDPAGTVVVSRDATLAYHEISPFVIDMENEGRLSERGRFRTSPDDLRLLIEHHLPHAAALWGAGGTGHLDIALYAHGGLTSEDAAAETARAWIPYLYSNRIFPIFLMWETGAFQTLGNIFEDAVRGEAEKTGGERWNRFKDELREWWNERLEGLARLPGRLLWNEMKDNARDISQAREAGVVQLLALLRKASTQGTLPPLRLHLIGHSAGSIVQAHLGAAALKQGFTVSSLSLLAAAVRLDEFDRHLGAAIAGRRIPVLLANLTDAAERADDTCKPYGHSLLYLVSRSFEGHKETPILGMEKHLVPALPTHAWGGQVQQLRCPGASWRPGDAATRATTHGGLDNDTAVRAAVAAFIHDA
ncbi:N-acetylmuramidase domain-containing protein [Lysobacter solisilvae (ex Woo and Kim 2020)]|uniref:N-acetylmuramidase domain-containing protein n=1 Tax=Agrilutibacter terrestris TaxID=2865112 RepID=UPI001ABB6AE8|nr:N-acetylmuramidase domain-containing protein [Lysobacter terrestris]